MATVSKKYELVFITHPERDDAQLEEIINEVKATIEKDGGVIDHIEPWGKKKLGYEIKKQKYGHYTMIHFTGLAESVTPLETSLRHHEQVLKFITFLHDSRSTMLKPPATDSSYYNNDDRYSSRRY